MKAIVKIVITSLTMLLMAGMVHAQVIADFEINESGFAAEWTGAMTGIARVADLTGESDGVLAVSMNGSAGGNGAMAMSNVDFTAVRVLSYMVYLPSDQNVPDSVTIKVYAQDNDGWNWMDHIYYAEEIPTDVWYPVVFDLEAAAQRDANFIYTDETAADFRLAKPSRRFSG